MNKAEGLPAERAAAEFHELALGEPLPISAAHGESVRDLLEIALVAGAARRRRTTTTRAPTKARSA